MRAKILGSAAGGGFPQWNCACPNCQGLRDGGFNGVARTQTQIAVSLDGQGWYLLDASPDLPRQIEATSVLHPSGGLRKTPIAAIILTGADLDQVLGLLMLRELQPLHVYATPAMRRMLEEENSMFGMLRRLPNQLRWTGVESGAFELVAVDGTRSGIRCGQLPLAGHYPAYARVAPTGDPVLGVTLEPMTGGGKLAFLPRVPRIEASWLEQLATCDVLLYDGTFWSDDELIRIQGSGRTAREMGHLPISGAGGTLERLAGLRRPRKIFVHINNTNPILDRDSREYAAVREAGWEVAEDGMDIAL